MISISTDICRQFERKLNCKLSYELCCGEVVLEKAGKSYIVKDLTAEEFESLVKKSIQDKHDYLFDRIKTNKLPPYVDDGRIY